MSVLSPDRFVAAFARLEYTERAALLADLWRERGQTVDRDGTRIELDGRRVVETNPARIDESVDIVVTPAATPTTREATTSAGATVTDGTGVYDLLLYGVDRDTAETIYRRHFGRSLYVTPPTDSRIKDRFRSSPFPAVLVVAVAMLSLIAVVFAITGVGIVDLESGSADDATDPDQLFSDGSGNTTGDSDPNGEAMPVPRTEETVDVNELASAHAAALRGEAFTIHVEYDGPPNGSTYESATAFETTITVENNSVYRYERRTDTTPDAGHGNGTGELETTRVEVYADGQRKFFRFDDGEVIYGSSAVSGASTVPLYVGDTRWNVLRFLQTNETSVERSDEGGFHVSATGIPDGFSANVSSYRAEAAVRPDGVVESLRVEYVDEDAGATVTFVQTFEAVGTTTVREPDWYADHPDRDSD